MSRTHLPMASIMDHAFDVPGQSSTSGSRFAFELPATRLGSNERGLVISPPYIAHYEDGESAIRWWNHQEIRLGLLLWDRIDFPNGNGMLTSAGAESDFLLTEGVLQRTYAHDDHVGPDTFEQVHLNAFRALDEREPGRWALARGDGTKPFPAAEFEEGRGVLFELHKAIPVPNYDVPLADILEFKRKRQPELIALRHHLERIYQSIATAPDRPLARTTELEALEQAIAHHMETIRERGFKLVLGSLQAKLDLKFADAVIAASLALTGPMTGALNALTALGIAAAYSVGSSVSLKRREKSSLPFEYVSRFHRDVF